MGGKPSIPAERHRVLVHVQQIGADEYHARIPLQDIPMDAVEALLDGCDKEQQCCDWVDTAKHIITLRGPKAVFVQLRRATKDDIEWVVWKF
jgi:hypothetical protein